jgi:hypothetical protein
LVNELELLSRYRQVEQVDPALIEATIQAIAQTPDRIGSARHHSPGPGRRRMARLMLVSASLAAAVAAIVALVTGAGGSPSPGPAPPVAQGSRAVLTAYVVQHSLAALETTGGYVERVVQRDSSGTRTWWRGPTQLLDQGPGQTATLWTWAAGVDTVLNIDYQHHTWSKSAIPAPSPAPGPMGGPPPPGAYLFPAKALSGPEPGASSIVTVFRQAGIEVIGTASVDGISTYQLSIPALDPKGKIITGKGITAWVDVRSYLPVRMTVGMPGVQGPNDVVKETIPWTEDFTWQPATPLVLAVFDLTPPALFRQIANPALQPVPPGH